MAKYFIYFSPIILIGLFISSCKKDQLITDSSADLDFSADTVLFDTVFTTIGSTTKNFIIYNNNDKPIEVSSIKLAGGASSNFRINIDGVAAISLGDIIIPKKDSLFVFVEVTVNPNNQNNPMVIQDSIVFVTNGNVQRVVLEAWGQDAYYHKPTVFPTNGFPPYSIIDCNSTWINDKPHVIYGYAVVDSGCTLTMQAGTRVHLYNKAILWVYEGGTLKVEGTASNKVSFSGTRLESDYADIEGQWGKIWLSALSKNNKIDWAIIKNGSIGIQVDTFASANTPTLIINNTIIKNMSAAGIYGQGASIRATNCVFANCGQYAAALTLGGSYSFKHCTFANYYLGERSTPLLLINNWYKDIYNNINIRNIDSAYFANCIIYGSLTNELGLDSSNFGGHFKYKLDHCLVKSDLSLVNPYHYNVIYKNNDPQFKNTLENDYRIESGSGAKDRGDITIGTSAPTDLKEDPRNIDTAPDLGAYEYE